MLCFASMETKKRETSERKLPLPVGKSDWEYITAHSYCVDKTLFIRDLLASDVGVALFTRPRRSDVMKFGYAFFGKKRAICREAGAV